MYSALTSRIKEPAGVWYYGGALLYVVTAYVTGWVGLFQSGWLINIGATLLLGHAMIIAAYLIHECGHNLVFRSVKQNAVLGRFLNWLCGSAYGTYEDIRYKHFRHHVDVDDSVWFDYEKFFKNHPIVLRVTRVLEWFYIPAQEIIMHFIMVFTSFIIPQRRDQRKRNLVVIMIRGGIFALLLFYYPAVAFLYVLAYLFMMTVLRFMDGLQHDYGYQVTLFNFDKPPRKGDFEWEQEHTFSVPHTLRWDWPNWFTLNFGFHNAHHDNMNTPWYRLPDAHRKMYGDDPDAVIPLSAQLKMFHRNRVSRIVGNHEGERPWGHDFLLAARRAEASGGNAASFLTAF